MSLIGRRIGNYEIKAKIGEGGMGTVYLGEHPLIGKRVAIKVLLEELVAKQDVVSRFFNEAKAVNDIGHLNIVDVVDFGKITGERGEDVVYFIMEFLDGEALSSRIRRAGLPFKDTLHIVHSAARRWRRRTPRASSTATSSPRTSSSSRAAATGTSPSCSTSASPS